MKRLFIMPLICAFISLLAIFGLSAMTVVPGSGAESYHRNMIFAASGFCVIWLGLAFWLRARSQASLPGWVRQLVLIASIFYVLGVLLSVMG